MKICGIICEFNPFHNGHKYLLSRARELSGCDYIVCIMSGSFSQRGDICVIDKFTRAKHAVLGGADCVIELPACFSTAPAEIFAKGALKILNSIPGFDTLAFGCEDEADYYEFAEIVEKQQENFKRILSNNLSSGESFIKSYAQAFNQICGNGDVILKPNNILAFEYAKTLFKEGKKINLLPIKRIGSGYNDEILKENLSSASAIRKNYNSALVNGNVPEFAVDDIRNIGDIEKDYKKSAKLILSRTDKTKLKRITGCSEGIENALKANINLSFDGIIEKTTTKRYSSSRIKRIICANFLKIYQSDCEKYLSSPLYLTPLAVKKDKKDELFSILSQSEYPIVTSGTDASKLTGKAKACKETDDFAYEQWLQISGSTDKKILSIN